MQHLMRSLPPPSVAMLKLPRHPTDTRANPMTCDKGSTLHCSGHLSKTQSCFHFGHCTHQPTNKVKAVMMKTQGSCESFSFNVPYLQSTTTSTVGIYLDYRYWHNGICIKQYRSPMLESITVDIRVVLDHLDGIYEETMHQRWVALQRHVILGRIELFGWCCIWKLQVRKECRKDIGISVWQCSDNKERALTGILHHMENNCHRKRVLYNDDDESVQVTFEDAWLLTWKYTLDAGDLQHVLWRFHSTYSSFTWLHGIKCNTLKGSWYRHKLLVKKIQVALKLIWAEEFMKLHHKFIIIIDECDTRTRKCTHSEWIYLLVSSAFLKHFS